MQVRQFVVNQAEQSQSVLQVQVVQFNTATSFQEQLQVIAGTGVFITEQRVFGQFCLQGGT